MPMPNLDARQGGTCLRCIASKLCTYVVACLQLIFWSLTFLTIIFKPSSVSTVVDNADTTAIVVAALTSFIGVVFSVILILGLKNNRRLYVKAYCIYAVVYLVLTALSFVLNILIQPQNIGFNGFISMVISFLIHLMFFFVVRSYYLVTYCNYSGQQHPNNQNQPKV